jgi:tetratricopeptide (TPR) repeat protein
LLSEAALAAGRDVDAEEYARQAANVLPLGDPLRADALALLARAQVSNGKLELAAQTVSEAKALERKRDSHKSLGAAWLIWVNGELLLRQDRFEDARPIMLEAIDQARSAEGVASGAAFQMRIRLAEYLINRNRPDESRRISGDAFRDFGNQGEVQRIREMRARVLLQEREFAHGYADYDETLSVMAQVKEFLLRQASVVPAELLAEHDFTQARIHLAYEDLAKAEPLLNSSVPLLKASSQSLWQKFKIASISGHCQMAVGDHAAADVSLREALEIWIQLGHRNLPFTAGVWGDVVTNLIMQGRIAEAEALLAKAPTFSAQGDKNASTRICFLSWGLGQG